LFSPKGKHVCDEAQIEEPEGRTIQDKPLPGAGFAKQALPRLPWR